eukprot:TRINITY_DN39296_c0_g1_i1.p1 TRINITY_DN39296_c0_g1~~TRINITY_DN39296_c0_g1_i1.p1  ORF type:complete len:825 (+),score=133.32 TRINITY_DN39296_c0_g1_i1:96-2570(+)
MAGGYNQPTNGVEATGRRYSIGLADRLLGQDSTSYFEFRVPDAAQAGDVLEIAQKGGPTFDFPLSDRFGGGSSVCMTRTARGWQAGRLTSIAQVPTRVLGPDDCDLTRSLPALEEDTQGSEVHEFPVPPGVDTGDELQVATAASGVVRIALPASISAGDVVRLSRRKDGSWRVTKAVVRIPFVVPADALVDNDITVSAPDGQAISLSMQQSGASPGSLVIFSRQGQEWAVEKVHDLPPADAMPLRCVRSGPYEALLKLLEGSPVLSKLPTDAAGALKVSVPFCSNLSEYPILGKFLVDSCLKLPQVESVDILATELSDAYLYEWALAERWFESTHTKIKLKTRTQDLAEEALPNAGLTLAFHPEVTWGGGWFQIIGSILRSAADGLCLFATFYEFEMKTLLNMVNIYRKDDAYVEVLENPFYFSEEKPSPPPLRYLIIVSNLGKPNISSSGGKVKAVARRVEIPMRVLTEKDCDRSRPLPPPPGSQHRTAEGGAIEFSLPPNCQAGDILNVPMSKDGPIVQVAAPGSASAGELVSMSKRPDGSWRIMKVQTKLSFVVPECTAGEKVQITAPDGRLLGFPVPAGVSPGDIILLKREGRSWAFDAAKLMPSVLPRPVPTEDRTGPYLGILDVLRQRRVLQRLAAMPASAETIHVNAPFCGRLDEAACLTDYLAEAFDSCPSLQTVKVFATDVADGYLHEWALAERWCERQHTKRVLLQTGVCDASEEALPEAALTIGIHPEVTWGGAWFQIIGSILRSSAAGLCLFATFYECEMQTLVNMVNMYRSESSKLEVLENPYYASPSKRLPEHPPMKYLVLVDALEAVSE